MRPKLALEGLLDLAALFVPAGPLTCYARSLPKRSIGAPFQRIAGLRERAEIMCNLKPPSQRQRKARVLWLHVKISRTTRERVKNTDKSAY